LLVVLALGLFAVANGRVFLEAEMTPVVPPGFVRLGEALGDAEISVMIALKSQNMHILTARLDETSDPANARYGQHMTMDEVVALTRPSKEAYDAVAAWLNAGGVTQIEEGGSPDVLKVRMLVAQAQALLNIRMSVFRGPQGALYIRSMDKYSVPESVAKYVQVIMNVNRLPSRPQKRDFLGYSREAQGSSPTQVTPQTIRKLYKVTNPTSSTQGIVQAVVSFLGQYWAPSDLEMFQNWAGLVSNPIAKLVGYNNPSPSEAGVEASLDVDYLSGIPEYVPTWVWSTNGTIAHDNEPWMVFLDDVVGALRKNPGKNFPSVFSMSYQDLEYTVSKEYAIQVCNTFAKVTATGITFVTGSGDWGVGCAPSYGDSCYRFTADFPSSCPYVTSLGGTYVDLFGNEVSVDFSSGGFSNYFPRPAFQNAIVNDYIRNPAISHTLAFFNHSGRAFPDLATVSTNFQVFANGQRIPVAGTSAATPTFAALVTMMDIARAAKGMSPMGWINPFLYASKVKDSSSFTDITSGDAQMHGCCTSTFAAIPGYDAVTGLGSPMYDKLLNLALNPQHFRN
jgi:tripeptidyl-peptidase-1